MLDNERIENEHRIMLLIYGQLLVSILIQVGIAAFLRFSNVMPPNGFAGSNPTWITMIILVFGITAIVSGYFVFYFKPTLEKAATYRNEDVLAESLPYTYYRTRMVLCWSLAEAISIYGFIIFMFNGSWLFLLAFSGVSLLLMLMNSLRKEEMRTFIGEAARVMKAR